MLSVFLQVIRRDLLLAMRQKSDVLNTLFFFVVVVTMVPLGIGPEPALLRDIAAGVVWVAALLAAILSLPRLFANDYADGTLEQMLLSAEPLSLIVLGKAAAHWITTGLPLTVMAVAFGVVFDLDASGYRGAGRFAGARHAGALADRLDRRRADTRLARRWSVNIVARVAALHSGIDFRRRRGRRSRFRPQRHRLSTSAGRIRFICGGVDAVGRGDRASHFG